MTNAPRLVFFALFPFACGYMLSFCLRSVNAVVAPDLTGEFALGPAQLGFLTAAFFIAFALFQLPLGVLLDRYGARRVQTVLLLIAALGCLAFAASTGFASLVASRALIGFGFSAGLMASYKSTSVWVPFERRSLANASIMAAGALGLVVATEPTSHLVALYGWRMTFVGFAVLIAAVAAFILLTVPEKAETPTNPPLATQTKELLAILRLPLFWRVVPMLAFSAGIGIAYQSLWAGPWFADVMQFNREGVARHLLWMGFAFLIGILLTGIVADRLQQRGISTMQTLVTLLIPHSLAQLVILLNIQGLAFPAWLVLAGCSQSAILAFPWFANRLGDSKAGRANATINFSMFVIAFVVQYGVGFILSFWPRQANGGYAPEGYTVAFAIFLTLQVAAMAWYWIGRKKYETP